MYLPSSSSLAQAFHLAMPSSQESRGTQKVLGSVTSAAFYWQTSLEKVQSRFKV